MKEIVKDNRQKIILVFATVFIFGLFAHGYCFFNQFYSHDALLVFQDDIEWQISLGRFMHPIYFLFRGNYYPPTLVGGLGLLFLALSSYLVIDLLEIKNNVSIILTSATMVTSTAFTLLNASYIHDTDLYMLALYLSILAVYLIVKVKRGIYFAPVFIVLSVGLYQAFIQCSIALLMILAIKHLLCGKETRHVFFEGLKWIGSLCAGLIIYYFVNVFAMNISGVDPASTYNGLNQMANLGDLMNIRNALLNTYHVFLLFLFKTDYLRGWLVALINLILVLISAYRVMIIIKCNHISRLSVFLLFLLFALVPFGFGITCFISAGMFHRLMEFSFCFVYIMVFSVGELYRDILKEKKENNKFIQYGKYCIEYTLILVLALNNCVFSNQVYLKKDLDHQSTLLTMTRIVNRIELTEGFDLESTPVVFVGLLNESEVFNRYNSMPSYFTGMHFDTSITFYNTYSWYLNRLFSYPIIILNENVASNFAKKSEVINMPCFPDKDSCQMIDGILVVKISDIE